MEYLLQKQQYTCPMHPEIIKDEPGDCPLCGMQLIPLKAAVLMFNRNLSRHQLIAVK